MTCQDLKQGTPEGMTYRDSGVDIDSGEEAVRRIIPHVNSTRRPEVVSDIGGFGGLFALDKSRYEEPILVSGTDGVGTKLRLALMLDKHDTIGIDAVAMCVNDIVVSGAEPLYFLDYLAVGHLDPAKVESIVAGVAEGCRQSHCALIGGEMAEMPGFYAKDDYDIAGFAVGVVDKKAIIDGQRIAPGDVLVGLPSAGIHSNGYSLVRKLFFEKAGYTAQTRLPELDRPLGETLLTPTTIYVPYVLPIVQNHPGVIKGMAHITGGGFLENIPRVLPENVHAEIALGSWPMLPIFPLMQRLGGIDEQEMYRTFNMGIGMVCVVSKADVEAFRQWVLDLGMPSYVIGEIAAGAGPVRLR